MIEEWIRKGSNDPSWKILLPAVAAEYGGGNKAHAEKLSKDHKGE